MESLLICLFIVYLVCQDPLFLESGTHFFFKSGCTFSHSFKCCLYILDIILIKSIFSQSVAYLLISLALSFTEQKLLIFIKSSLSIISCVDHIFGVISQTHLQKKKKNSANDSGSLFQIFNSVFQLIIFYFK